MGASKKKILLLITTIYSFFTCFLLNAFGWALSYEQLTYEWKILNIHEGRRVVFNYAIFHFVVFAACCLVYFRPVQKKNAFVPVRASEAGLEDQHQTYVKQ